MPTYEYNCQTCNNIQEEFHSIKEEPIIICSKCKNTMKRGVGGGTGFIFKSGSTRGRNDKARYGKSKKFSTPTPVESSLEKAETQRIEKENAYDPANPYK